MYKFIKIIMISLYNVKGNIYGDEKFNSMLEIDILGNSPQNSLGVLRAAF